MATSNSTSIYTSLTDVTPFGLKLVDRQRAQGKNLRFNVAHLNRTASRDIATPGRPGRFPGEPSRRGVSCAGLDDTIDPAPRFLGRDDSKPELSLQSARKNAAHCAAASPSSPAPRRRSPPRAGAAVRSPRPVWRRAPVGRHHAGRDHTHALLRVASQSLLVTSSPLFGAAAPLLIND
jgi:hypothetical protein